MKKPRRILNAYYWVKETNPKSLHKYNSNYMTFWKSQNYGVSKKNSACQRLARRWGWKSGTQRIFRAVKLLCVCVCVCVCAQSRPNPCDPCGLNPTGSLVHGISQARILEQIGISYTRGSSWSRDLTWVSCISCIGRWILYHWATWDTGFYTFVQTHRMFNIMNGH